MVSFGGDSAAADTPSVADYQAAWVAAAAAAGDKMGRFMLDVGNDEIIGERDDDEFGLLNATFLLDQSPALVRK